LKKRRNFENRRDKMLVAAVFCVTIEGRRTKNKSFSANATFKGEKSERRLAQAQKIKNA